MATTSMMKQAVGTAAAVAFRNSTTPRGVREKHIRELQQMLMDDDCWLPWHTRTVPELSRMADLSSDSGDCELVRNGMDRNVGTDIQCWRAESGTALTYTFEGERTVEKARIVFDSNLCRDGHNMNHRRHRDPELKKVPETMVKEFRLEKVDSEGNREIIHRETNNYQRLVRIPLHTQCHSLRLIPESTWGEDRVSVFAFDVQ